MLKDFHGAIQSDGYALYEALVDDTARAREFLVMIAGLYLIEKEAQEGAYTPEARKAWRQEKPPALLERLHRQLVELEPGKAIRYTLDQWEALVRYLEDGRYKSTPTWWRTRSDQRLWGRRTDSSSGIQKPDGAVR